MATPIKKVVLPYLLEKGEGAGQSAEQLFLISKHYGSEDDSFTRFKGGLFRLAQRGFLEIDKTKKPWSYSLTELGRAHGEDLDLPRKEARARRRRMLGLDEDEPELVKLMVTVRKAPEKTEPVKPPAPMEKLPIRMKPGTVEGRIIDIMEREGAITGDEIYELAKEHGYNVVRGYITRFIAAGCVKLDLSVDPLMWHTISPSWEQYIQERYALEVES